MSLERIPHADRSHEWIASCEGHCGTREVEGCRTRREALEKAKEAGWSVEGERCARC
jgi:hypothetical protein